MTASTEQRPGRGSRTGSTTARGGGGTARMTTPARDGAAARRGPANHAGATPAGPHHAGTIRVITADRDDGPPHEAAAGPRTRPTARRGPGLRVVSDRTAGPGTAVHASAPPTSTSTSPTGVGRGPAEDRDDGGRRPTLSTVPRMGAAPRTARRTTVSRTGTNQPVQVRGLRTSAKPAPGAPAVILRLPPPLDPPVVSPPPEPPRPPGYAMDPLPFDWPPGAAPRPPARETRRTAAPPPKPTVRSESYQAAKRFAGLCVEVLNGYRPANQLRPLAHPQKFADISDQLLRRTVRIRMTPGKAANKGSLVRVRRVLVAEPVSGVAEGVVVLEHSGSSWAMAVRFEKANRPNFGVLGWVCTLVQVV